MSEERRLPETVLQAHIGDRIGEVIAIAAARSPRPRLLAVADEDGACVGLMSLARATTWDPAKSLADCQEQWPMLLTLPAGQSLNPRDAALFYADDLLESPQTPGIALVDEKGRLVDVWLKVALYRAAPELERASAGTRGDGASFESLGAKGLEEAAAAPGVPVNGQLKTTRYGVIDMAKQVLVGLRCAITVSVDQDAPPEVAGTVELTLRRGSGR